MILTNRRHRYLTIALAGMEAAWLLPFAWLLLGYAQSSFLLSSELTNSLTHLITRSPIQITLVTLLLWVLYAVATDLINRRQINSPRRELWLMGIIIVSSLLVVRATLYATSSLFSLAWLYNTARALLFFNEGWQLETLFIVFNIILWVRVVMATGRLLTFSSVGLNFRLGLLIALIGNGILFEQIGLPVPLQFFAFFIAFGLMAVALARIDEKSMVGSHSTGALLSWPRMTMIGITVMITLGIGLIWTTFFTPQNILNVISWFGPVWRILGAALGWLFELLFWLIAPFLEWLIDAMRSLMSGVDLFQTPTDGEFGRGEPLPDSTTFSLADFLQSWPVVRYTIVIGIGLILLLFLWIFFVKPYLRDVEEDGEETEQEAADWGLDGIRSGLERLRNLARLVGKFGLSLELLEAISVENMYANLTRIARQRGYPRQPNQPPDQYLPVLMDAFPNQREGLHQLTHAYMRVHYGEQVIGGQELKRLRTTYELIYASDSQHIEPEALKSP
ncbi:MAG: DUF4129 domain-containing protein [Chloroflexota bacterium]